MSYYPPYKSSSNNVKVELDLTKNLSRAFWDDLKLVILASFYSKNL